MKKISIQQIKDMKVSERLMYHTGFFLGKSNLNGIVARRAYEQGYVECFCKRTHKTDGNGNPVFERFVYRKKEGTELFPPTPLEKVERIMSGARQMEAERQARRNERQLREIELPFGLIEELCKE